MTLPTMGAACLLDEGLVETIYTKKIYRIISKHSTMYVVFLQFWLALNVVYILYVTRAHAHIHTHTHIHTHSHTHTHTLSHTCTLTLTHTRTFTHRRRATSGRPFLASLSAQSSVRSPLPSSKLRPPLPLCLSLRPQAVPLSQQQQQQQRCQALRSHHLQQQQLTAAVLVTA